MACCLGATPSTGSPVMRDITVQVVTLASPESLEGRNLLNTCPNGASEESIGIYAKNRCQWTSRLIKRILEREIWPFEPTGILGTATEAEAPKGSSGLPKQKCVLEVP